jgi:sugar lactone lactonase YvrE
MFRLHSALLTLLLAVCSVGTSAFASETSLIFTTLAGSPGSIVNSADGTGSAAQFSAPRGVAVDSAGNVYVADSGNHTVRKVTSGGVVTTVAGTAGSTATVVAVPPGFHEPFSVAVDSAGTVYVADTNNAAIRKISPSGVVTTLAGGNGSGYADGVGSAAKFHEPRGIALDGSGNLYVADYENNLVRKVTAAGVVTTLAGGYNTPGTTDGQGTNARFMLLNGIAVDSAGNVFVADAGARAIRKITSSGLVTTFAGGATTGQFGEPRGIAVDSSGNVFVADYSAHVILKVTAAGVVSKVAGTAPTRGSTDGSAAALFNAPSGIALDSANNLYVADTSNNTVRKISPEGNVSTLAGLAGRSSSVDGKGPSARFEEPYAVATDGTYVYVADHTDHTVRKISADGTVTTLAGKAGSFGTTDATGANARFNAPMGIAADSAGTVYVADTGNASVRKITAGGVVTTLAGTSGVKGSTDASGSAARFSAPAGVAVDGSGNVFVVDSEASTVRKIAPGGEVTTLAGRAFTGGFTDSTGASARFSVPYDVTVDTNGNLYVIDRNNHAIRKITPAGVVTTLAGSGSMGYANGNGRAALFKFPSGIAVDQSGYVYVADTDNQVIRKINPAGEVSTIAGGSVGSTDGVGTAAKFYNPKDVAVDVAGSLYVADRSNHTVRKGTVTVASSSNPADCLFNWAEQTYGAFFSPSGAASTNLSPFYYRFYSGTSTYLAVSSSDNSVWVMGPATGGRASRIGATADLFAVARCPSN